MMHTTEDFTCYCKRITAAAANDGKSMECDSPIA